MHEYTSTVRDVSDYPEMQDLLCTADMLITDYSSSVWDYSFTYRPCFLFTPDLEEYKKKTDFYTPIEEWGFPICKTNEELRKQIEAFDENKFKQAMIRHHENLGSYEKGTATEEVAKLYFHILITNFIMRVKELLQSVLCRCVIESDLNRIKKAINKYSVISFDIFDTLLQRKVSTPSDVFDLVEKNIIN